MICPCSRYFHLTGFVGISLLKLESWTLNIRNKLFQQDKFEFCALVWWYFLPHGRMSFRWRPSSGTLNDSLILAGTAQTVQTGNLPFWIYFSDCRWWLANNKSHTKTSETFPPITFLGSLWHWVMNAWIMWPGPGLTMFTFSCSWLRFNSVHRSWTSLSSSQGLTFITWGCLVWNTSHDAEAVIRGDTEETGTVQRHMLTDTETHVVFCGLVTHRLQLEEQLNSAGTPSW